MARLGPMLAGLGTVVVVLALVNGVGGGLGLGVMLAGGGAVVVGGRTRWSPATPDSGWHAPVALAPVPTIERDPRPVPTPRKVSAALARVEARELVRSPAFGAGLGFSLMMLVLFGIVWSDDNGGQLAEAMELYPIFVHPLAGLALVAAHRARTRSTRDGAEELFESCPTPPAARTGAHLRTAWVAALAGFVFVAAFTVAFVVRADQLWGPVGARQLALVAGSVVIAAGGVFLGVAVARWAPWAPAPVVAVVLVGLGTVQLATFGGTTSEPVRQLALWLGDPELDVRFTSPHWAAHHGWVLALAALTVVVALAHDRRTPRLAAVGAGAAVLAVVAGVAASRPIDAGDARRIADLLARPEAHQTCTAARGLDVCAYRGDEAVARRFAAAVAPVAAAVPAGVLDGWSMRQGADTDRRVLDAAIRRLLPAAPASDVIPAAMQFEPGAERGGRMWVGLVAAGVRPPADCARPTVVAGQARGVLALWLATRGVDAETAAEMTHYQAVLEHGWHDARPWPDNAGAAPVVWALSDLTAARRLLAAPENTVAGLVASRWDHLVDPTTTTDELLSAAGLAPVGPPGERTRDPEC